LSHILGTVLSLKPPWYIQNRGGKTCLPYSTIYRQTACHEISQQQSITQKNIQNTFIWTIFKSQYFM